MWALVLLALLEKAKLYSVSLKMILQGNDCRLACQLVVHVSSAAAGAFQLVLMGGCIVSVAELVRSWLLNQAPFLFPL